MRLISYSHRHSGIKRLSISICIIVFTKLINHKAVSLPVCPTKFVTPSGSVKPRPNPILPITPRCCFINTFFIGLPRLIKSCRNIGSNNEKIHIIFCVAFTRTGLLYFYRPSEKSFKRPIKQAQPIDLKACWLYYLPLYPAQRRRQNNENH